MSALKIPKLKCAQKTRAETSSAEKSPCRNVHIKKFLTWNVLKKPVPKSPVSKNPRAEMSTVPKCPRAETSTAPKCPHAEMSAVPKCPCAETSKVPKHPCAEMSPVPKCPCAEIALCRNVHVSKCPRCRNVHVPKRPRSRNVCAEMSIAEMLGAEMSPRPWHFNQDCSQISKMFLFPWNHWIKFARGSTTNFCATSASTTFLRARCCFYLITPVIVHWR